MRFLDEQGHDLPAAIQGAADEHDRCLRRRRLDERRQALLFLLRSLALPLRNQQLFCLEHHDDALRHHHRQRVGGVDDLVNACIAAIKAVDVERAQPFVHELEKLGSDIGLLDLVGTDEDVQRSGFARRDVLSKRRGGHDRQG
jgi:hypothetical protein